MSEVRYFPTILRGVAPRTPCRERSIRVAELLALLVVASPVSLRSASPTFQPGPFDFAAYATGADCGAITLSGNTTTDSFDSSKGTYAQTKQLSGGNVGANGNTSLSGNVTINGFIAALNKTVGTCRNGSPGISITGKSAATGGYIQLSTAAAFADPPVVTPGPQDYHFTANASLLPGSYGNIALSGHSTLTLAAGTYNINSITLSGQSVLRLNPPGQVIINVAGNNVSQPIQFSGGSIDNPSGTARNFQLIYGGNLPIAISGGSTSYAVLYAPNAAAALSGGSDWFGSMVVGKLEDSGGAAIHYDRSLATLPTITAVVSPPPNAAGWNRSDATVTFTCADSCLCDHFLHVPRSTRHGGRKPGRDGNRGEPSWFCSNRLGHRQYRQNASSAFGPGRPSAQCGGLEQLQRHSFFRLFG